MIALNSREGLRPPLTGLGGALPPMPPPCIRQGLHHRPSGVKKLGMRKSELVTKIQIPLIIFFENSYYLVISLHHRPYF